MASLAHAAIPANAKVVAAAPQSTVEFEIFLPLRNSAGLESLVQSQGSRYLQNGKPCQTCVSTDANISPNAQYHQWLTPGQFATQFGPTASSVDNATAALTRAGLQVERHSRSLHVTGTVAQVNAAFSTSLNTVTSGKDTVDLVAATPLKAPDALQQEGVLIGAFTGVPQRQPNSVQLAKIDPDNRYGVHGPYWFDDLKQAYDYPSFQSQLPDGSHLNGNGVNVAVLMENDASDSDLAAVFNHEKFTAISHNATPHIKHDKVDGGGAANGPGTLEADLDVQQVLGGAPAASVTLVSIPNLSDQHVLDGYVHIVDENKADIVNSSFGGCELNYTAAYNNGTDYTGVFRAYHEVFLQGNAQGITFVASSGDSGGLSCPSLGYFRDKPNNSRFVVAVQNPADDPAVTSVGGTNVETTATSGSLTSTYVSENSFGDPEVPYDIYGFGIDVSGGYWGPGGGRSVVFDAPLYQQYVTNGKPGRAIPDVGMQVGGCPGSASSCNPGDSAVVVGYSGGFYGVIGTSVASPEFVGALALYEQSQGGSAGGGRQGNLNPFLYTMGRVQNDFGGHRANPQVSYFHKKIPGFDGVYHHTSDAYDYMIGNGTPDVRVLFGFTNLAPAGDPQTSSNP